MRIPIFVRPLTQNECQHVQVSLHSSDAFVLQRCQILLASSRGEQASAITRLLGYDYQTVRNVIHGFNMIGLAVLQEKSSRPRLLHCNPRDFGKNSSLWTLELAAQVSFEKGLTPWQLNVEPIRKPLKGLGLNWKRAKHWITSHDPQYQEFFSV